MKVEITSAFGLPWSEIKQILDDSSVAGLPDAEKKLAVYFMGSNMVWVGKVDDRVVCLYGLVAQTFTSSSAYLWMLHTKAVDENKFVFIRHSQQVVEEALKIFEEIHGHVLATNESGKRWLKWLGAEFSHPLGLAVPFVIRKNDGRSRHARHS